MEKQDAGLRLVRLGVFTFTTLVLVLMVAMILMVYFFGISNVETVTVDVEDSNPTQAAILAERTAIEDAQAAVAAGGDVDAETQALAEKELPEKLTEVKETEYSLGDYLGDVVPVMLPSMLIILVVALAIYFGYPMIAGKNEE